MGLSAQHASTVPLVLHATTGYIKPQFHVVFDDWFATISTTIEDLPNFNSDEWRRLFGGDSTYQYLFDKDDLKQLESCAQTILAGNQYNHQHRSTTTASSHQERGSSLLPFQELNNQPAMDLHSH